jgi:hypothetical protein
MVDWQLVKGIKRRKSNKVSEQQSLWTSSNNQQ